MQTVERVEVEEQPIRPRLKAVPLSTPTTEPAALIPEKTSDPKRLELMLKIVVQILSIRAILLLAMSGAFVLATKAMADQTPMALGVLGIYCSFAILPIAYLEIRSKTS